MGCGGCSKRRESFLKRVKMAMDEEEHAISNNIPLSHNTEMFLKKNKNVIDKIKSQKEEINKNAKYVRPKYEHIENQISKSRIPNYENEQSDIIQKIKESKSVLDVVPENLKGYVKAPEFDPFKAYPILTAPLKDSQKESIMRTEKIFRRNLYISIETGNKKDIARNSSLYSDALFNLFLLGKREG